MDELSPALKKASDDLANSLGNWLSDQIALGNPPLAIWDAFSRALGIGMRMYAEASAEGEQNIGVVVGGVAKAAIIYAAQAQVSIEPMKEH